MKGSVVVGWLFLAIWSAWLFAFQGRTVGAAIGAERTPVWLPDVGVLLFVSLAPYLQRSDVLPAGLLIASARIAVSIDPPTAILAGHLAIAVAARGVRQLLALEGLFVRAAFAGLGTLALGGWLAFINQARSAHTAELADWALLNWRQAFATAACAGLFAPLLARLPGLTPLRKRRSWPTAASFI